MVGTKMILTKRRMQRRSDDASGVTDDQTDDQTVIALNRDENSACGLALDSESVLVLPIRLLPAFVCQ